MPWVIKKRGADLQESQVCAAPEQAKVIGIPVRGLLKAYLESEASESTGRAILSSLVKPLQNLASKITELLDEPFVDTRAQYGLIEDSDVDTAEDVIVPDGRSRRARRDSAYQQWRAETLLTGARELDVEDLGPLSPSAGMDTRTRLKMLGLL
ncbi:hypothetical protein EG328_000338 [Venturia inaequalis]|nr:hypothetical protein EG328_000338 [Venturia inaequalis]RDI78359.1 hypothetical protein Vi05172_g11567 [Venturia inaequalis]